MLRVRLRRPPAKPGPEVQVSKLRIASSESWLKSVLGDFDAFMLDHATCERKASATALSLVSHYPDRRLLVQEMMVLAREELEHFHQMLWLLQARGLVLPPDEKDLYVQGLRKQFRHGSDEYLLDRLLVAGIVEARGCERFGRVADALEKGPLRDFYQAIARSEAQHHALFYNLALNYFDAATVEARQDELLDREAEILRTLPVRPIVH
jgi:tRNA-(ms[2]io[6]A)-hydroxylase